METEQVDLRSFVARCVSGEKQNDSVDSGVCPSPAEGFQNYDEAFPPLSTFADDGELNLVVSTWQSASKRPADPSVYSFAPSPIAYVDCSPDRNTIVDSSSPIQAGATPIKRAKLQPLNDVTNNNRSLRSCPDLPSQKSFLQINAVGNGNGGITFCCPMVNAPSTNNVGPKHARASPQFVVPKCFEVGSWPMRSGKGCKHANDVPFWTCSEWFCTVHKGLEFGLLSAKVGADAAKCLAPHQQQQQQTNNSSSTTLNSSTFVIQKDAAAARVGGGANSCFQNQTAAAAASSSMDADAMFDAPRFILHIINENENVENEFDSRNDSFVDANQFNENYINNNNINNHTNKTPPNNNNDTYDWTMTSNAGLAEFTFMPYQNNNLQPNVLSSFPTQEVGFCLPKFDLPSAEQQCKIQSSCNASPFSKLSELHHSSQPPTQQNSQPFADATTAATAPQQPATVAVPISPSTHFVPIRSESMEDAYYPKPGFDDSLGSLIDDDDYFVYRDRGGDVAKCAPPVVVYSCNRPIGEALTTNKLDETTTKETKKASAQQQRRSLPLKFKASLPVKIVQTDGVGDCQRSKNVDDELTSSLEADFEIWACKPVSISGSLLSSIQWPENFDGQLIVGPFSSVTWGDRQQQQSDLDIGSEKKVSSPVIVVAGQKSASTTVEQPPPPPTEFELWQRQEEHDDDLLLQFVSNISLISPLDSQADVARIG